MDAAKANLLALKELHLRLIYVTSVPRAGIKEAGEMEMSEIRITRRDVDDRLRGLRVKYGFSSEDFRSNPECRNRVSDQDEFDWESCLVHAEILREQEEELHRRYLVHLVSAPSENADRSRAVLDLVA